MLTKTYVKYSNEMASMKRNFEEKLLCESGADHGSNLILAIGISVIVVALLITALKAWVPDAFQKVADKAMEVIGLD